MTQGVDFYGIPRGAVLLGSVKPTQSARQRSDQLLGRGREREGMSYLLNCLGDAPREWRTLSKPMRARAKKLHLWGCVEFGPVLLEITDFGRLVLKAMNDSLGDN